MTRRRLATIAVLGAIAALGTAALVDALRPGSGEASDPPRTTTAGAGTATLESELAARGVDGVLYYSDPEDDCRVHAVQLPGLEPVPPPKIRACSFELPPDPGTGSTAPDLTWSPDGRLGARCRGGLVSVRAAAGPVETVAGCAPAWRPDGSLTVIRGGEVWGERRLLSRRDLERAARTLQIVPPDPRYLRSATAFAAAWLTDTRAAVLVRIRFQAGLRDLGPITALAVFEGRRLLRAVPHAAAVRLRPSPGRTFVAVVESNRRVTVVDRNGRSRLDPTLVRTASPVAVAWSPDERWTAVAGRWSVFLVPTRDLLLVREPRIVRLPLAVRDLAWR